MGDERDIGLVDAHAEGDGCDHHHIVLADKAGLVLFAGACIEAGVIRHGVDAVFAQEGGGIFHPLARQAVDDAALPGVLLLDKAQQLLLGLVLFDDVIGQVRPVKAGQEDPRLFQPQVMADLLAGIRVGGGGQGNARHVRKAIGQYAEFPVFRTEVVSPLADAMRFVNGEQADFHRRDPVEKARAEQAFRCDVQQFQRAGTRGARHGACLLGVLGRIEEGRGDAKFGQCGNLVLHQCDQRADDDGQSAAHQRGNLEAQGLAATGRHQHQRMLSFGNVADDVGLRAAEIRVTKYVAQDLAGVGKGGLGRVHRPDCKQKRAPLPCRSMHWDRRCAKLATILSFSSTQS